MIQFDLSEIPENAEVMEASLYVYALDETASLSRQSIEAFAAPGHWEESGLIWSQLDNKTASVCTSSFIKGIPGSSPGTYRWDITDIVQSWVSGDPNYGVVLKIDSEEFDDYIRLYSRENPTFKPYLNVIYTPTPPVPSPEGPAVPEISTEETVAANIEDSALPEAEVDTDGEGTEAESPPPVKMDQFPAKDLPPDQLQPPAGPFPPVITQHPASQKKNPGKSATFSVGASGTPPLSFQWKKDGLNMPGETAETLTFESVAESDGGVFTCLVENGAGSAESIAAILSVNKPVVITTQPESGSIIEGESVTFSVTAAGSPPLSFQWEKNHIDIPGATSNKYSIVSVEKGNAGVYTCEVKNSFSNGMSAEATLAVLLPPLITGQPKSQTINIGMPAAFSVSASGTPPLSFQWKKDGLDMPGQTAETLTFGSVSESDGGVFTCIVENVAGSEVSVAAILSVNKPAVITTQPESASIVEGGSVIFSVTAAGSPPLSHQWKKNHTDIPGATSAKYAIKSVQEGDAGAYICEVKNSFSNDMSAEAALAVLFPPRITSQPKSRTINIGMPAAFSVSASGTPPLSFQWKKDGLDMPGQTAETLTFGSVSESDRGVFICRITNAVGSVQSDAARLYVAAPPEITLQPASQLINPGNSVTFSVSASGTPPLSFQWKKDGMDIPGQTADTLTIPSVSENDEGGFTCRITNAAGSVESDAARLFVATPPEDIPVEAIRIDQFSPQIISQPKSQTINAGMSAAFSVSASGTPPLSFQWKKDGMNIPGQTADTLTIPSVSENDEGVFTCRITNAAGSVESDAAQLYVATPPKVTRQPASQLINPGKSVTFSVSASGTPPLSFQWLKDGSAIDGQTGETLTIDSVSKNDGGVFTCRVANTAGSVESDGAQLYVATPPEVKRQPSSQLITPGKSVTFSVSASGTPPLSFQWLKDGRAIDGQTGENFTIPSVSAEDQGVFTCRVANTVGSVESDGAQLYVAAPPEITRQPVSRKVQSGKSVTFSISALGTPPLFFQWKKDSIDIPGATADHFTLPSAQKDDEGVYTCEVRNDFSQVVSAAAELVIEIPSPAVSVEKTPPAAPEKSESMASEGQPFDQKPALAIRNLFLAAPKGQNQCVRNGNILTIMGSATSPAILVSAHLEDNQERMIRDVSKSIQIDPDTFDIKGSVFVGSFRRADAVRLKLIVRDPEASQSAENTSNFLFVDKDSPKVQVTAPKNNAFFRTSPILIHGTASDDLSGIASVEVSTDGGRTYRSVDAFRDGHWEYVLRPNADGAEYNIYAKAIDKAGLSSISDHLTVNYMKIEPPAPKIAKTNKNIHQDDLSRNANKSLDDIGICTYRITDIEHSRFQPTELFLLEEEMAIIVKGYGGNAVTIKIMSAASDEDVVVFELVDYIPEEKHKMWRWKLSKTGSFKAVLFVDGIQKDDIFFKIVE